MRGQQIMPGGIESHLGEGGLARGKWRSRNFREISRRRVNLEDTDAWIGRLVGYGGEEKCAVGAYQQLCEAIGNLLAICENAGSEGAIVAGGIAEDAAAGQVDDVDEAAVGSRSKYAAGERFGYGVFGG